MAREKITKPGQLDLFLKKEGVYNIDGDKVKPEDLKGYYKDKYLSYNHDDVEYKNRDNLAKGIKAKKLLGLELSEKDKNFKSNKQIKAIREKEIIKEKEREKKRIEDRKKIIQKHKESRGIRTNTKLQQKIAKELEKAKKIGSKVMPKRLKILKSLLTKNKNTKPKPPTKKKSGGRLNDGTAFIKSLYKDKL